MLKSKMGYWTSKIAIGALATSVVCSCGDNKKDETQEIGKTSYNDEQTKKVSAAMGHFVITNLMNQQVAIDIDSFIAGVNDAKNGKQPAMDQQELLGVLVEQQQKENAKLAEENLQTAEEFLKSNKEIDEVVSQEDGKLQYIIVTEGAGDEVKEDATPLIHYEGSFIDGTVFDSSKERGEPVNMPLSSTIPGFRLGIAGMKKGEVRKIFIHPDLGYGQTGQLPANSLLIFEVNVLETDTKESE